MPRGNQDGGSAADGCSDMASTDRWGSRGPHAVGPDQRGRVSEAQRRAGRRASRGAPTGPLHAPLADGTSLPGSDPLFGDPQDEGHQDRRSQQVHQSIDFGLNALDKPVTVVVGDHRLVAIKAKTHKKRKA